MGVNLVEVKCYDNKGDSFDRYSIILEGHVYAMSHNPSSPQGFNQYCCEEDELVLQKKDSEINFSELPQQVQKAIQMRAKSE